MFYLSVEIYWLHVWHAGFQQGNWNTNNSFDSECIKRMCASFMYLSNLNVFKYLWSQKCEKNMLQMFCSTVSCLPYSNNSYAPVSFSCEVVIKCSFYVSN